MRKILTACVIAALCAASVAAQTTVNLHGTVVYGTGTSSTTPAGTSNPTYASDAITAKTPAADIRAYGAKCDGTTDDTAALQAAITALAKGGRLQGPAAGATCYIANPAQLTWGNSGVINLTLQGVLKVGTTFVIPDGIDIIGDGGGSYEQYQGVGPAAGITGVSTNGTLGTSFSAGSATFTPSTMSGIVPGAAITVAGTVACSVSSIARTSNVVIATLSSSCRVPPGASVTVAGISDTSYNGTFFVTGSDYVQNTVTWRQTAANGSSSGGTVTGLNEDSVESVSITATTSTTATATFAHAHNAADRFGVVVIATKNMSFGHKSLQNITVSGCGGACVWTNYSFSGAFKNVGAGASQIMTSIPLMMSTTSNWVIEGGSFLAATGQSNPGLPWGIYFTETYSASGDTTGAIEVSDSFISRGVKFDLGGYTRPQLANGMKFRHTTMERAASAVRIEPAGLSGAMGTVDLDMIFRQDNLDGFTDCVSAIVYTDKFGGGGQVNLSEGPNVSQCPVGGYFDGELVAKTQGHQTRPSNTRTPIGIWMDGRTVDAEMPSEGANLSPSVVPYATANLPDATSWTSGNCSVTQGVTAPDGSTTAVQLTNTSWQLVGNMTVASVATGDRIVYGGWWKPSASGGSPNGGYPFYLEGTNAAPFDSSVPYEHYPTAFMSGFSNPWWTPVVAIANIATGDNASHTFGFRVQCPGQVWGTFMMYVPASVPTEEVQRLQRQLLHGFVPGNLPSGGGVLGLNPNHKFYWGSATNLYKGPNGSVKTDQAFDAVNGYKCNGSYGTAGQLLATNGTATGCTWAGSSGIVSLFGGGTCSGYLKSDGSCATPTGTGTVTGTGTGGKFTAWSGSGAGQSGITDTHMDDGQTSNGYITITEPITLSGLPAGCTMLPCAVAKVSKTTVTATVGQTTIYTTPSSGAGMYELCMWMTVPVAGTGGTVAGQFNYAADGNNYGLQPSLTGAINLNTQWSFTQGCRQFYSDASRAIGYGVSFSSPTGSPSVDYTVNLRYLSQ